MSVISKTPRVILLAAMLTGAASVSFAQQPQAAVEAERPVNVYGSPPPASEMTKGPEVEGIISARSDGRMQVATADGSNPVIVITEDTRIKSSGGFLGLNRS